VIGLGEIWHGAGADNPKTEKYRISEYKCPTVAYSLCSLCGV